MLRPESTDSAVHKPSFVETVGPKKYMDTDNKSTKILVHATLLSNEARGLSSHAKRPISVLSDSRSDSRKGFGKSVTVAVKNVDEGEEEAVESIVSDGKALTAQLDSSEADEFVPFGEMQLQLAEEEEEEEIQTRSEVADEEEEVEPVKKQRVAAGASTSKDKKKQKVKKSKK